jgi:hypothetical protein
MEYTPEFESAVREVQEHLGKTDRWGNSILRGKETCLPKLFECLDMYERYLPKKYTMARQKRRRLRHEILMYCPTKVLPKYVLEMKGSYEWCRDKYDRMPTAYAALVRSDFEDTIMSLTQGRDVEYEGLTDLQKGRLAAVRLLYSKQ